MSENRKTFRLMQDGMCVAEVEGDEASAFREILHYAAVYSQDGPVSIEGVTPEMWKALAANSPNDPPLTGIEPKPFSEPPFA